MMLRWKDWRSWVTNRINVQIKDSVAKPNELKSSLKALYLQMANLGENNQLAGTQATEYTVRSSFSAYNFSSLSGCKCSKNQRKCCHKVTSMY